MPLTPAKRHSIFTWFARLPLKIRVGVGVVFTLFVIGSQQKDAAPVPTAIPHPARAPDNVSVLPISPAKSLNVSKPTSPAQKSKPIGKQANAFAHYDPSKPWRKQGYPGMTSVADERAAFEIILIQKGLWQKLITAVGQDTSDDDVKLTLVNEWHYQPFDIRLQAAQNLWKLWASVHSPENVDTSSISLVDVNGNSVGGSTSGMGSVVNVDSE